MAIPRIRSNEYKILKLTRFKASAESYLSFLQSSPIRQERKEEQEFAIETNRF